MKRDMKAWLEALRDAPAKKAMPILSFPAVQLMGITVRQLISSWWQSASTPPPA